MLGNLFLIENQDHLLNQARSELVKQEHQIGSLNSCTDELHQLAHAQRLELEDAHGGYTESRREQIRLQDELSLKEKALRETLIRHVHEMGDMKRAQELRVDEVSAQKLRESHETIQRLTSQMHKMQATNKFYEWFRRMFKKWKRITVGDCITVPVNQQRFQVLVPCWAATNACHLTHGIRLDYCKTFCNQFSTADSSRNDYQRIHHSLTPGDTRSVPVHTCTRTLVAIDEDRNKGTIPMSTFARRPTISSLFPVDIPQNSMVGQQRKQRSELQFDTFPAPFHIRMFEDKMQKPSYFLFWFSIGSCVVDQESKGLNWRWKRKRYMLPVERKRPVFEGRPVQFSAWEWWSCTKTDTESRSTLMTRGRSTSRRRSARGRSETGRILRQPCRCFLKGSCTISRCEYWHPPWCQFSKNWMGLQSRSVPALQMLKNNQVRSRKKSFQTEIATARVL